MDKSRCCYPGCGECPYPDCVVEQPEVMMRRRRNREKERLKKREYRARKREEAGVLTQKEQMIQQQDKVYDFVVQYITEHLYPPTLKEIGAGVGIKGTDGVQRDLRRLQDRGLLKIDTGYRAIRLVGYRIEKECDAGG